MTNNILIINGNNSPIDEKRLISYFSNINNKSFFFLHEAAKPKNFNNKETLVRIFSSDSKFHFKDCNKAFIIESLTSNSHKSVNDIFCETEFLINSIKIKNSNTKIYLIATDLGYARQDRAINKSEYIDDLEYETAEPEGLKLKLQNLYNAGLSDIIIFDPHSIAIYENCKKIGLNITTKNQEDFLSIISDILYKISNIKNEKARLFFDILGNRENTAVLSQIESSVILDIMDFFNNKLVLVAPDKGCSEKIKMLAQSIHQELTTILLSYGKFDLINSLVKEIKTVIIKKIRTAPGQSFVAEIDGIATNRICLIIDDILDTGGTLCNAAEALKNDHKAKSIHCFITHGVLSSNAVEKLNNSCIETVNLTNSITSVYEKTKDQEKFEIYDLFELIVKTINNFVKNNH